MSEPQINYDFGITKIRKLSELGFVGLKDNRIKKIELEIESKSMWASRTSAHLSIHHNPSCTSLNPVNPGSESENLHTLTH